MNTNFDCKDDFNRDWSTVDDRTWLLQNCYRRLKDQRLFYDATWGKNLDTYLSAAVRANVIAAAIERELIREPDVLGVSVSNTDSVYRISIKSTFGPIEFDYTNEAS